MTSAAIIEGVMPKPIALSVGDPLTVDETKQSLRSMANGIGRDRMSCQKNCSSLVGVVIIVRIPRHHRGCIDHGGDTEGVERCDLHSFTK